MDRRSPNVQGNCEYALVKLDNFMSNIYFTSHDLMWLPLMLFQSLKAGYDFDKDILKVKLVRFILDSGLR